MANIDLKLSSKEDKITHRSEILIRFYQGQKIDFRVKTGLFILACPSIRQGSRNGFQMVHKHHTTQFADACKDFGITKG